MVDQSGGQQVNCYLISVFIQLAALVVSGCSQNRVGRKIFGPETEEVSGCSRKLHIEVLHDLYFLPDIVNYL